MDSTNPFDKGSINPALAAIVIALIAFYAGLQIDLSNKRDEGRDLTEIALRNLQIDQLAFDQLDTLVRQIGQRGFDKATGETILSLEGVLLRQMRYNANFVPQGEIPADTQELLKIPLPKIKKEGTKPSTENDVVPPPPILNTGRLRARVFFCARTRVLYLKTKVSFY